MSWQETIVDELREAFRSPNLPQMYISRSLRRALGRCNADNTVDDTQNQRALRFTQYMAEYAMAMIAQIAVARRGEAITELQSVNRWWPDRSLASNTNAYDLLFRVSRNYFEDFSVPTHVFGELLIGAAKLLRWSHSISIGEPREPTQPLPGRMVDVVKNFVLVSSVHREVCGEAANNGLIDRLTRRMFAHR